MQNQTIRVAGKDAAVRFAAKELARHLELATGEKFSIAQEKAGAAAGGGFRLGVCHDLGIEAPTDLNEGEDWIAIRRENDGVILTGSNPRSVLFAVYRYLRE